jgi:hypothetical protein
MLAKRGHWLRYVLPTMNALNARGRKPGRHCCRSSARGLRAALETLRTPRVPLVWGAPGPMRSTSSPGSSSPCSHSPRHVAKTGCRTLGVAFEQAASKQQLKSHRAMSGVAGARETLVRHGLPPPMLSGERESHQPCRECCAQQRGAARVYSRARSTIYVAGARALSEELAYRLGLRAGCRCGCILAHEFQDRFDCTV